MDTNEELVYRIQRAEAIGDYIQSKKLCGILYEKNKGLIFETTLSYKKNYAKNEADKEEFDSVAKLAFMKAVFSYNPSRGSSFATWAKYNEINFTLCDYVRKNKLIQIPTSCRHLLNYMMKLLRLIKKLIMDYYPQISLFT